VNLPAKHVAVQCDIWDSLNCQQLARALLLLVQVYLL